MLAKVLRIHWHDKQPVFSAAFDPTDGRRLVTAGGDNNVRVWGMGEDDDSAEYRATMSRHVKSVNCVRFSHAGDVLASTGDGGVIILWRQVANVSQTRIFGAADEDEDGSEHWSVVATMRAPEVEDVYDLCWSPDDKYILVGLTDNSSQIWEVATGRLVRTLRDHHHFVQGVAWDPLGRFLVTQGADRTVKVWQTKVRSNGALQVLPFSKLCKIPDGAGHSHMFHDETLVTFFRRPAWSPDGALLFVPAGLAKTDDGGYENCFYIMSRGQLGGLPVARIGGFERPVFGISCNPRLFRNIVGSAGELFVLPYRLVYAAFTMDAVAVFDTRQRAPIVTIRDLHYGSITDVAWAPDGYSMVVTSTDGFCSVIGFGAEELGETLTREEQTEAVGAIRLRVGAAAKPSLRPTVVEQLANASSRLPSSDPMDIDQPVGQAMAESAGSIIGRTAESEIGRAAESGIGETVESVTGGAAESVIGGAAESAGQNGGGPPVNMLPAAVIKRRVQPTLVSADQNKL